VAGLRERFMPFVTAALGARGATIGHGDSHSGP